MEMIYDEFEFPAPKQAPFELGRVLYSSPEILIADVWSVEGLDVLGCYDNSALFTNVSIRFPLVSAKTRKSIILNRHTRPVVFGTLVEFDGEGLTLFVEPSLVDISAYIDSVARKTGGRYAYFYHPATAKRTLAEYIGTDDQGRHYGAELINSAHQIMCHAAPDGVEFLEASEVIEEMKRPENFIPGPLKPSQYQLAQIHRQQLNRLYSLPCA